MSAECNSLATYTLMVSTRICKTSSFAVHSLALTSDNFGSSCIVADVDAYFGHNAAVEVLTVGGGAGGSYGDASGEVVDAAFPAVRKSKLVEADRDAPGLEHKVLGIACQWMYGFIINSPFHAGAFLLLNLPPPTKERRWILSRSVDTTMAIDP